MAGEKHLPDGRRFYSWEETGEMPDTAVPCPVCGRSWDEHPGKVEFAAVDGHQGYVMPRCPDG